MSCRDVQEIIEPIVRRFPAGEKKQKQMTDALVGVLQSSGYLVDPQDRGHFFDSGLPAWRSKHDDLVVETLTRRKIDLVVYESEQIKALIEIESDLNDLREVGVSKRGFPNNYDVFSIAKDKNGSWYHSYHSLERMAVAAFCYSEKASGRPISSHSTLVRGLECICSDRPDLHNPANIPIILVSVKCRSKDARILAPRLHSLNAKLLYSI